MDRTTLYLHLRSQTGCTARTTSNAHDKESSCTHMPPVPARGHDFGGYRGDG